MTGRSWRALSAVATLAVTLSACSVSVTGSAVRDPAFDPSQPNPILMRAGNYPTVPRGRAKPSREAGVVVDAQRLADAVVGPWEIDPALINGSPTSSLVIKSAEALSVFLLDDPSTDVARGHGFINGFASSRGNADDAVKRISLSNAALRFPTPQDAAAVADELIARLLPLPGPDASPVVAIDVPGHPEARATQSIRKDGAFTVRSFTPRGVYLLYQVGRAQESPDVAAGLVARTLDVQAPRIDAFTPIDAAQLATIDPDPTGLLARTLPSPAPSVAMGVFTARAILHSQVDPFAAAKLYDAAGVDVVSSVKTRVHQARDAAAAGVLAQELAKIFAGGPKTTAGPSVDGLPAARCFVDGTASPPSETLSCVAPADRWVITASSNQPFDVTQQVAAQYLMLTAK